MFSIVRPTKPWISPRPSNQRSRRVSGASSIVVRMAATRNGTVRLMVTVFLLTTGGVSATFQPPEPGACPRVLFDNVNARGWEGPWVFSRGGSNPVPFPAIAHRSIEQLTDGPIPIRLDDGTKGTLRTESRECGPGEDCAPYDCGCTGGAVERVWIEVRNAADALVSRMHLWASYGDYQIVPVDLVDGPGDELMIFRIPNHASPPIGFDMKIWKIGATKPIDLHTQTSHIAIRGAKPTELEGFEHVAGHLPTLPFSCATWRTFMTVDLTKPKPRSIALMTELSASEDCRCYKESRNEIARVNDIRLRSALRFNVRTRQYELR
jgi:hypothetical protein